MLTILGPKQIKIATNLQKNDMLFMPLKLRLAQQ